MQAFLHSYFLQALSYSLIASIWQMALLWLSAILILKICSLTSAQKFNIAFIAQVSGFTLFIYTCFNTYNTAAEKFFIGEAAGNFLFSSSAIITELIPYTASIYLCILLFKFLKFAFTYKHAKGLKNYDLKKISAENRIFVQQMSALFSIHRKVKIYLSEKIICPLTIGFFKPVILIPVAAINHLTTDQMEAVILHELAHIKRADYLLFIVQNIIEKFFFFNIFSSMLSEIIEQERENACDDWVLQFNYNSMHYAEALFKLGRLKTLPVLAMNFTGKKESLLLVRIKRLLHNTQSKNQYNFRSLLFGFFSIIIVAFLFISTQSKPVEQITAAIKTQPVKTNKIVPALFINTAAAKRNCVAANKVKKNSVINKFAKDEAVPKNELDKQLAAQSELNAEANLITLKQNYLVQVRQKIDSIKNALPQYQEALNNQLVITPEILQKAVSYQNFKQIENMLAASGDSIHITETPSSKNSYQKEITIKAKDKYGNTHVYKVIVKLYQ